MARKVDPCYPSPPLNYNFDTYLTSAGLYVVQIKQSMIITCFWRCFFILKYGWSLEAEGLQSNPLHLSKRILFLVDSPPGILRGFTISGVFWLFGAFHPFSRFSRVTGEEEVAGKRQTAKWENPVFCQMEKFTSRFLASSLPLILKTFQILLLLSVTEN